MTTYKPVSIGKEAAIALYETSWWEGKSDSEIFETGINTVELCLPFGELHRATEGALQRPVWTHEFVNPQRLWDEHSGATEPPTMMQIIEMIPAEKRVLVVVDTPEGGVQ